MLIYFRGLPSAAEPRPLHEEQQARHRQGCEVLGQHRTRVQEVNAHEDLVERQGGASPDCADNPYCTAMYPFMNKAAVDVRPPG